MSQNWVDVGLYDRDFVVVIHGEIFNGREEVIKGEERCWVNPLFREKVDQSGGENLQEVLSDSERFLFTLVVAK